MMEEPNGQDHCDRCQYGLPCKPHGNQSLLVYDNVLPSGLSCPYSVCDECRNYNEGNEHILPTRTSIFCFDCINIVKQNTIDKNLSTMMVSNLTQPTPYSNIINAPIVSNQKHTIDLSQLSPSPTRNGHIQPFLNDYNMKAHTTPKRLFSSLKSLSDDAKRVSFQCDNMSSDESLTPKRLFSALKSPVDEVSNESSESDFMTSDESCNGKQLSNTDNQNQIVARNLPSWNSFHCSESQLPCAAKKIPS